MSDKQVDLQRPPYVEEYPHLLSWAGRRAAPLIHSPAIVQHLGFWIADIKPDVMQRVSLFDRFCRAVETSNQFHCETRFDPAREGTHRRRYQTCRLKSKNLHFPMRMTLQLHHEYLTVSTVIELPILPDRAASKIPFVARLSTAVTQLRDVTSHRYEELAKSSKEKPEPMNEVRERLTATYEEIFLDVWDEFYDQVLNRPVDQVRQELEGLFADFRGFVATSLEGPRDKFFTLDWSPPARNKAPRRFSPNESIQRAHAILPFMTADPETMGRKEEKEVTISRFLDGRCIYASTLGAQPPESEKTVEQPLTYFVLTTDVNSWQTGRLIDRIHTLGTLRLAARRFSSLLGHAGDALHDLEKDTLEKIDTSLPRMIVGDKKVTSDEAIAEVMKKVSAASTKLIEIRSKIPGGLPYRVERSRYYRSQFKSLITALRIGSRGRIEGFQPYDEFVERRFGSAYEFIDMVGKRFDRIEEQLQSLYQRVRTAEAARLQRDTERETNTIESFQRVAEYGFFLVLFMYYIGQALVNVSLPLIAKLGLSDILPADPKPTLDQIATISAFLMGAGLLIFMRWRKRRKKIRREKEISRYFNPDRFSSEV